MEDYIKDRISSETLAQYYFRTGTMKGRDFVVGDEIVEVDRVLDKHMRVAWAEYYTMFARVHMERATLEFMISKYQNKSGTLVGKTWDLDIYESLAFQVVYITAKFVKRFLNVVRLMGRLFAMSYIGNDSVLNVYGAGPRIEVYAMKAFSKIARFQLHVYHSDPVKWLCFKDKPVKRVGAIAFVSHVLEHYDPEIKEETVISLERDFFIWDQRLCWMKFGGGSYKMYGKRLDIIDPESLHNARPLFKYDELAVPKLDLDWDGYNKTDLCYHIIDDDMIDTKKINKDETYNVLVAKKGALKEEKWIVGPNKWVVGVTSDFVTSSTFHFGSTWFDVYNSISMKYVPSCGKYSYSTDRMIFLFGLTKYMYPPAMFISGLIVSEDLKRLGHPYKDEEDIFKRVMFPPWDAFLPHVCFFINKKNTDKG